MQKLQKVTLFETPKEFGIFLVFLAFVFMLSLSFEYHRYKQLTQNKTATVEARVLKSYLKTKNKRTYRVLKLQLFPLHTFYTTTSKKFYIPQGSIAKLKLYTTHLGFLDFLRGFFAKSWFYNYKAPPSFTDHIAKKLHTLHKNSQIYAIYAALFLAQPLPYELSTFFSSLGISHLFALSGFHIAFLTTILFFVYALIYTPFHKRFFPYRDKKRDIFILTALSIFIYMYTINIPPSLLRAFGMMIVGFYLYSRGFELFNFQTLFITILLLLAVFPPLFFSLGFWLSVLGVFYILLFLQLYPNLTLIQQFFLIPVWVYLMMLPTSLYIFGNFSVYHPISVGISYLFGLFYPLSLFVHLIGCGSLFDPLVEKLLHVEITTKIFHPAFGFWLFFLLLGFITLFQKKLAYLLVALSCIFFSYYFYKLIAVLV